MMAEADLELSPKHLEIATGVARVIQGRLKKKRLRLVERLAEAEAELAAVELTIELFRKFASGELDREP